ncbi:YfaZ family outer membrane protein [Escherichia coli]
MVCSGKLATASRLFGEHYPDSLSSGIKSYREAMLARYTIMRPVSIEAGYRYLMSGKDGNRRTTPWLTGPYVGAAPSY